MQRIDLSNYTAREFEQLEDPALVSLISWNSDAVTDEQFEIINKILISRGHDNIKKADDAIQDKYALSKLMIPILLCIFGVVKYNYEDILVARVFFMLSFLSFLMIVVNRKNMISKD